MRMGHVITIAQQKGGTGKTTLAAHLAVEFARRGKRVVIVDTDPQGSLGRWFMARAEAGAPGMDLSTSSAWGVAYETDKLRRSADIVIVDTPPKADADLRPALRAADLVIVPVTPSPVDLWATDGVLDLARRENRPILTVLNRTARGRQADLTRQALAEAGEDMARAEVGSRIAYARAMGTGATAAETASGPWAAEIAALADEIAALLR
jgi:chromosome partitioning protein